MDTQSWPWELASRCLKTERQKKRARKKDFQKKLIQLYRQRDDLWQRRGELPMVPLEEPYQRGWKRFFVLRDDVARSGNAAFYAALLEKINTVMYSPDKSFQKKKRRFRKMVYVDKPQFVRAFRLHEWYHPKLALTEQEKAHFHLSEEVHNKQVVYKYVFSEPWRYVLRVEPHMITHAKLVDEVLEQQIAQLSNYIEQRNLGPAMERAKRGNCWRWWKYAEKKQYRNPLEHVPLHSILGRSAEDRVPDND